MQGQLRHTTPKITLELYAQAVSADQHRAHEKVVEMVVPPGLPSGCSSQLSLRRGTKKRPEFRLRPLMVSYGA